MTETDHNKRLAEVLSHAKCPRCNSSDKEAIASVGDNYNLRCKHCWYEWTESWHSLENVNLFYSYLCAS